MPRTRPTSDIDPAILQRRGKRAAHRRRRRALMILAACGMAACVLLGLLVVWASVGP